MKLIHCQECKTVRSIKRELISCDCIGVILGFNNTSFNHALAKKNVKSILGIDFEAFVIGPDCESIIIEEDL